MAYSKDIPQPTDEIDASQNDLLENFRSISTLIGIDHVNFDAPSGNQGKHNTVSMPNFVGVAASPVAVADEIKLFAKADGGGITQLFVLPEAGDTLLPERNITGATRTNTGETILPSGIEIKWGRASTNGIGESTVVFATAFPTSIFTVYAVNSQPAGTVADGEDGFLRVYTFITTQFQVRSYSSPSAAKANFPYTWFAIGV